MQNHASTLAAEFKLDAARVAATVALIDEGNTIPFIARYRKEATGSMDDQTLRALDERLSYLRKLDDQNETAQFHYRAGRDDAGDRRRAGKGQNAGGG